MFGLMKARACSLDEDAKEARRLQYCGTCKTLGSLYGQRTRFLLNHDAVFLGEILSSLEAEARGGVAPHPAIVSKNCLVLPAKDAIRETPLAFAAAATVVLAEAKLADHAVDSGKLRWRLGQRFYSRSFEDASLWLREHAFPIDDVLDALAGQAEIEARVGARASDATSEGSEEMLASLAEPTAFATGAFFAHGARLTGRPETEAALRALGRAFGSLAYRLDALEDYEKDARAGEFNAYRAALGLEGPLSEQASLAIRQRIWSLGVEVSSLIRSLPVPSARSEAFAERLRANLSSRLGLAPKQAACACVSALTDAKPANGDAPEPAKAKSWRESFALLFNLPFLASAVSGLSSPLYFSASGGMPEAAGEAVKHAKKAGGGGGGGADCCCCDGCCDSCDCGDCCGGCDC